VNELIVHLAGVPAGRLILKDNGNLQFRYDADYAGPPLSWALPVQLEAHPHAVCRAVFGGLLPEGIGREAIARGLGLSPGNDYALLEGLGGDCAGAITLLPPGFKQNAISMTHEIDADDLDRIVDELPQRPLAANPRAGTRLSLAGAQPKVPVIIEDGQMALPLSAGAPTTHIVKPEPDAFPGLVDNEAFCMELARRVGLTTASASKHRTRSGTPYLLVERYDRDLTSDPIRRLHQEDFCQALGNPSDRKYVVEGGPSVSQSISLLREASAAPARDIPRLWQALVFNWLIGNCDAHGKNFSLLYDSGSPTLAPLYDLVSTTAYSELTRRLAMGIDGARNIDEISDAAWNSLAGEVGVRASFAQTIEAELNALVLEEADALRRTDEHENEVANGIALEILSRGMG